MRTFFVLTMFLLFVLNIVSVCIKNLLKKILRIQRSLLLVQELQNLPSCLPFQRISFLCQLPFFLSITICPKCLSCLMSFFLPPREIGQYSWPSMNKEEMKNKCIMFINKTNEESFFLTELLDNVWEQTVFSLQLFQ